MGVVRKIHCFVESVTDHGDRVYTVTMKPERPLPSFLPGQFLHLALDEYDPSACWPESRVFSIASSPSERDQVRIVYSVKGVYTARMEKELAAGRGVWIKLPYGEFKVDGARDAVLIAGGTGITAFQSFIEGLVPEHSRQVVLLYGARSPELLLARDAIEASRGKVKSLRAFYFSETTGGAGIHMGRVTLEALKGYEVGADVVYYLAGPPPMVSALKAGLEQGGVPSGRIQVDAWE